MIKAIFFDLDNTLCNSDTAWSIAAEETFQLLQKYKPSVSDVAVTKAWTNIHQELFQQLDVGTISMAEVRDMRFKFLFNELNLPPDKLVEELNEFLSTCYIKNLLLYEDVTVLDTLHEYHVGIITNGAHDEHTDSQLSKVYHLGLKNRIQSLTISDEIGVRKPKFEIFKAACDRANIFMNETLLVGDSIQNDIVGANRAGMTSVFLNRKLDVPIPNFACAHPDYVISDLYDVMSCLEPI